MNPVIKWMLCMLVFMTCLAGWGITYLLKPEIPPAVCGIVVTFILLLNFAFFDSMSRNTSHVPVKEERISKRLISSAWVFNF